MVPPSKRRSAADALDSVPPASAPETTPTLSVDHSFALQMIMDLQRSVGQLTAGVEGLKQSVERTNDSVEKVAETLSSAKSDLNTRLSSVEKKLYAAWVVGAVVIGVGAWMINAAKEIAMPALKSLATPVAVSQPAVQNVAPIPPASTKRNP